MSDPELIFGLLQSALSFYGATYLLSSFGLPAWYLQHLSLNELYVRKAPKWRLWLQGTVTVLGVGALVYSAAYALIAAIPYDWGYHDGDDEWQATRDTVRFLITLVGGFYLSFSMDKVAQALIWEKIERKARQAFLHTLSRSHEVSPSVLDAAMDNLRRE